MNREAMPNADHSQWVSPDSMAGLLKMWADGNNRPKNGSFAIIKNEKGMAIPEFVWDYFNVSLQHCVYIPDTID